MSITSAIIIAIWIYAGVRHREIEREVADYRAAQLAAWQANADYREATRWD